MSSPVSRTEKEKQKLIQEKCQTILASMLRDEDNKYCVDCDAKGPRWASWNLGIFLCIRCAGIHRNLGVHISRVKSVNLDSWTPEQVVSLQQMGNSRARAVYEANLPDSFRRPQTDSTLESFIRAKYEAKKHIAKEWVCPPPVKVSWDAEIEMEMKRKKEAKRKTNGSPATTLEFPPSQSSSRTPRTAESTSTISSTSSSAVKEVSLPAPIEVPSLPAPTKTSSAAQDLLGLDTAINSSTGNDLFGGLLTTPVPAATNNGSTNNVMGGASKNADEDSFFNQKTPSTTEKRTLDKNSIMALYNQGGATTSAAVPPMQNMFASQGVYSTPQPSYIPNPSMNQSAFGSSPSMNQTSGMMAGNFNPLMQQQQQPAQGNMFSSPMFSTNGAIPQTGSGQMGQLSQQLNGLNFGGPTVHNPMMSAANTANLVPGMMMMGNMSMNPAMAANNSNPYNMFMGLQPAPQQQQQQQQSHTNTLSTNLWQ
ncbi:stromal membrane-associated protein 1-like [Daphnia pulex]|uniref:stromal membrane-associated protein 1-like n=1 Tax=Daphnia pulex TaxID=6669 RepID=UPI001EE07EBE|nr:stromal membrane-associated protein 1-like [Daphnia pulex]